MMCIVSLYAENVISMFAKLSCISRISFSLVISSSNQSLNLAYNQLLPQVHL